MSATHPDGTYTQAIENASLSAARVNRAAKDQRAENERLIKRIDAVEQLVAQLTVRLDALEALGELIIDVPIPFDLAEVA